MPSPFRSTRNLCFLVTLVFLIGRAKAGETSSPAVCDDVDGVLLASGEGNVWRALKPKQEVPADALLVAMFSAKLHSKNNAVEVLLKGDIGHHAFFPVMESAVRIKENPNVDLDLTLERGIVVLVNKKKGPAHVRLRILGETLDVTLKEPETKMGLEIYGRHAPGNARIKLDNPTTFLFFLVLKGHAILETKKNSIGLSAPPGPAMLRWDSIFRQPEVQHLDKLPEEIKRDAKEMDVFKKICACVHQLEGKAPGDVLDRMVRADDQTARETAVTAMGAIDDLPRLLAALADPKHVEVREQAVLVLRHWLGRSPGQVKRLQKVLADTKGYSPVQGRTVVQLLFGFDGPERADPSTYDLLIGYLQHKNLAVRHLAHWHLVRLAPAGNGIPFDAAASEEQRGQAVAQWRELIPRGQVPARKKTNKSAK